MATNTIKETAEQKELRIALEPYHAGEQELKDYMRAQGAEVLDVSNNPEYWDKDIDIIVDDYGTVEIKWDGMISRTGNMFIELITDVDRNKDGWFKICQADYLYYGDKANRLYYVFNFKELKDYLRIHKYEFKTATSIDNPRNNGYRKKSFGLLVPIAQLYGMYKVVKLDAVAA